MKKKLLKKLSLLTTCAMLTTSVAAGCGKESGEASANQEQSKPKENTAAAVATDLGCIDAEAFAEELNDKYAGEEVVVMIERAGVTYPTWDIEYIQGLLPDITITSKPFANDKAEHIQQANS